MEQRARLEIRRAKTAAETSVRLSVPGDMELDKLLEVQRRIFEQDLPRLIRDFSSCGNCKSGLGRFIVDVIDPEILVSEVSPLRVSGRIKALELENKTLRSMLAQAETTVDIDMIDVAI